MGSIGMPELIVIFVVVLLLFGSQRLPDLARGLGKGIREFKKAANDIKSELDSAPIKKEMREIEGDIKKDLQD
jgi:sec-independent protein translocase protein TatA